MHGVSPKPAQLYAAFLLWCAMRRALTPSDSIVKWDFPTHDSSRWQWQQCDTSYNRFSWSFRVIVWEGAVFFSCLGVFGMAQYPMIAIDVCGTKEWGCLIVDVRALLGPWRGTSWAFQTVEFPIQSEWQHFLVLVGIACDKLQMKQIRVIIEPCSMLE